MKIKYLALFLLAGIQFASAESFTLPTLTPAQVDPIARTLNNGFIMKDVEPASDLGKVWGFYLGFGASLNDGSAVNGIFQGSQTSFLPMFDAQLGLTLPLGLTAEFAFFPSITLSGTTVGKYAGAVKWTLNKFILPDFLFDLGAKVSYSNGSLAYSQTLGPGTVTINYGTSIFALQAVASKNFKFIEPYISLGFASAASTLSNTGATPLFSTGAMTTSLATSSVWFQGGLLLKLAFIGLGGEYSYLFGISSWNLKLSVRI